MVTVLSHSRFRSNYLIQYNKRTTFYAVISEERTNINYPVLAKLVQYVMMILANSTSCCVYLRDLFNGIPNAHWQHNRHDNYNSPILRRHFTCCVLDELAGDISLCPTHTVQPAMWNAQPRSQKKI